jgi:hypothetical protein
MPQPLIETFKPDIDAVIALYPDRETPVANVAVSDSARALASSSQPSDPARRP